MTRRRWIADEVSGNERGPHRGSRGPPQSAFYGLASGRNFDIATGAVVRRGRVASIEQGRVQFELGEEVSTARTANITLLLAIFKFDRMEWAIEKCTELGISRLVPVIGRRTDAHLAAAAAKRVDRWRRIALQAAEQSRRAAPPEILAPVKLQEAANASTNSLRIVLAESEQDTLLREVLASSPAGEIVLAIGPEGGWADDELQFFDNAGWIPASLGSTILRAETAAIAAIAITISEVGA